jgi:hypothetical protein
MTDEDKEGLAREKNRYRKASTGIYSLSLYKLSPSTVTANKPSS